MKVQSPDSFSRRDVSKGAWALKMFSASLKVPIRPEWAWFQIIVNYYLNIRKPLRSSKTVFLFFFKPTFLLRVNPAQSNLGSSKAQSAASSSLPVLTCSFFHQHRSRMREVSQPETGRLLWWLVEAETDPWQRPWPASNPLPAGTFSRLKLPWTAFSNGRNVNFPSFLTLAFNNSQGNLFSTLDFTYYKVRKLFQK